MDKRCQYCGYREPELGCTCPEAYKPYACVLRNNKRTLGQAPNPRNGLIPKIEIRTGFKNGLPDREILIEGVNVSKYILGVGYRHELGRIPEVTLTLKSWDVTLAGFVELSETAPPE